MSSTIAANDSRGLRRSYPFAQSAANSDRKNDNEFCFSPGFRIEAKHAFYREFFGREVFGNQNSMRFARNLYEENNYFSYLNA